MSENFRRSRRHKRTLKSNFIVPILFLLLLSSAIWTNYTAKGYNTKISDLTNKINSAKTEATEIESKNNSIKDSIAELEVLIEKIKVELN